MRGEPSEKRRTGMILLHPLGNLFLSLAGLRRKLYGSGTFKSADLGKPTISVGNITFGGTGKTPLTIFLAKRAVTLGRSPAVLLRGYGRSTCGARIVDPSDDFSAVGDEALVLARNLPGIAVAVGERRAEAAKLVSDSCDLIILDDAFQHLPAKRDLDIVILDSSHPAHLKPPPLGRLREPLSSLASADIICITRGSPPMVPPAAARYISNKPVLSIRMGWLEKVFPTCENSFDALRGIPMVAFTGVGSPSTFFAQAREIGLDVKEEIAFPDHAPPTARRIDEVSKALMRTRAKMLLCTEKDAVKWFPVWKGEQEIVFPRLSVEIAGGSELLDRLLLQAIVSAENKRG